MSTGDEGALGWRCAVSRLSPAVCVAGILMAPLASLAHHSAAMYETEKTVTVSGTV